MTMNRFAGLLILMMSLPSVAMADDRFPLDADRILFLGDSITHAGGFINLIELQLRLHGVDPVPELLNAGLPSETCTGLSEPDHPFPRPDVHERLERALQAVKPNVVVACYGMNDGIYYPFSEDRFQKYQAGINRLIEVVHASGARLILMTPPPFDSLPLRASGKLLPEKSSKFAWFAVFENYDDVMRQYAAWILDQKDRVDMVIDLRTPILAYWQQQREADPTFTVAPDGVHCNAQGHQTMAEVILTAWGVTPWLPVSEETMRLIDQKNSVLRDAWLTRIGHKRPGMPPGIPLEEARSKAAGIDGQVRQLLKHAASSR